MKLKSFLNIALVLLFFSFWTCDSATAPIPDKGLSSRAAGMTDSLNSKLGTRGAGLVDSLGSFEIDSVDAVGYINDYVNYCKSVTTVLNEQEFSTPASTGQNLVYGAKVRLALLLEVLSEAQLKRHTNDSLFVMLGIIPTKSNPSVDSTSLIFSLKSGLDDSYQYFDFTVPCPNACPDWISDDES